MTASKNGAPEDLLAEAEAAEAEAARAEAEAAAARVRASELREQKSARPAREEHTDPDVESATIDEPEPTPSGRWHRGPSWNTVAVSLGVLALMSLLALSGAMIWQHREAVQREQRVADFSAAARQGVINLMSLNFTSAQSDLQRVIDSTTGSFRDDFQNSSKDFMTVMEESKVVTTSDVKATGVQSMSDDSAVVLVAATSQVSNTASKQPTPRAWRLSVTVNKVDGGIKMSKVEFVP